MKIVPIKIKLNTLYENRHLFTDDSHYNSLVISNAIDTNVNLITVDYYNQLEHDIKYAIYADNKDNHNYIFILDKNGLYRLIYNAGCGWEQWDRGIDNIYYVQCGNLKAYSLKFFNWEELKLTDWLDTSRLISRTLCILEVYI